MVNRNNNKLSMILFFLAFLLVMFDFALFSLNAETNNSTNFNMPKFKNVKEKAQWYKDQMEKIKTKLNIPEKKENFNPENITSKKDVNKVDIQIPKFKNAKEKTDWYKEQFIKIKEKLKIGQKLSTQENQEKSKGEKTKSFSTNFSVPKFKTSEEKTKWYKEQIEKIKEKLNQKTQKIQETQKISEKKQDKDIKK